MRTELGFCLRSKYFKLGTALLLIGFAVYTALYFYGLRATVAEYQTAGMSFTPFSLFPDRTLSVLHFWYGTAAPFRLPNNVFSFYEATFSSLIIPILLAFTNLDSYLQDVKGNVKNVRIIKEGKLKFYFSKSACISIVSFVEIFVLLILQFIAGLLLSSAGHLQPGPLLVSDLLIVLGVSARIALLNAVIMCFSFSLSLYMERIPAAVYAVPLVVTLSLVLFLDPPAVNLSFYSSNLVHDAMAPFYLFLLFLTAISIALTLLKTAQRDQL